jgi:hypothetical protein
MVALLAGCDRSGGDGVRGSGIALVQTLEVPAFSGVELSGIWNAEIETGSPQHVDVHGDDNIVALVTSSVRDGHLQLGTSKSVSPKLELGANVTVPMLSSLVVSGVAHVTATGTAPTLTIDVSGASTVDTSALQAQDVTVHAAGSATVTVSATGILDVTIAGAAHVRYKGTPREVRKRIAGAGTLEAI